MGQQTHAADVDRLPEHMQTEARRYVEEGRPPGGFLRAVLTNDFAGAVGGADDTNRQHLVEWAQWLYNDVPARAWGSNNHVESWVEAGGLNG